MGIKCVKCYTAMDGTQFRDKEEVLKYEESKRIEEDIYITSDGEEFIDRDIAYKHELEIYNKRKQYVYTFEFEFWTILTYHKCVTYYNCVRYREKTIEDGVFNNCNIILIDESMKSIKFVYTMKEKYDVSKLEQLQFDVMSFMNEATNDCNCDLPIYDALKKVTSKHNESFIIIRL